MEKNKIKKTLKNIHKLISSGFTVGYILLWLIIVIKLALEKSFKLFEYNKFIISLEIIVTFYLLVSNIYLLSKVIGELSG